MVREIELLKNMTQQLPILQQLLEAKTQEVELLKEFKRRAEAKE